MKPPEGPEGRPCLATSGVDPGGRIGHVGGQMLRSMMTVSGFTAVSRVLGFLRDILIGFFLGTGMISDAYQAAFRLPNLFRRVFGEGAFNAAFIPLFGRKMKEEGKGPALKFANNAFTILFVVLGIGTLIAIPLMPKVMDLVAPGFGARYEKDLGQYGAGHADPPEFTAKLGKARDLFVEIEAPRAEAVKDWAKRIVLENPRFVVHSPEWYREISEKLFRVVPDDGEVKPLAEAECQPEGLDWDGGTEYAIGKSGAVRIRLPKDHRYAAFRGRFRVEASSGEVYHASIGIFTNEPEKMDKAVFLARIMFGYLLCMALAAQLSGVLNTFKVFGMPAATPIILNVVAVSGLALAHWQGLDSWVSAVVLAVSVMIAGVLQCLVLWVTCRVNKSPVSVTRPRLNADMRRLFSLMGPGVVSAGIQQVNLLVGGIIASLQVGAISYLYYSDRIYQLPLGMIGIALGVVLLPEVTRQLRSGKEKEAAQSICRGMVLGMLITLPATVAMLVIAEPIIQTLFERGEFTSESTRGTSLALMGYALGLPGYVLVKVLQPGYFAREDTKTPMMIAGISVAVNIVVSLVLFQKFDHVGIAIGTAVAAWVNVFLLWRGLKDFVRLHGREKQQLRRMLLASVVLGVVVWLAWRGIAGWFDIGLWARIGGLALLVGLGVSVYGFLAIMFRATTLAELREGFGKGG